MRGGRCCFAVGSKSFEILVEVFGGKLKGEILERCRGVSWWIRFGERSLCCLLEGVEACCRGEDEKLCNKGWVEDGREFRLELRSNGAGRLILCSVCSVETKRFTLSFPEGRSLPGGWSILAEKLRFLGVVSSKEMKLPSPTASRSLEIGSSSVNPLKGSIVDLVKKEHGLVNEAVWIQIGEEEVQPRTEHLSSCLVGRWGDFLDPTPDLLALRSWVGHNWSLRGGVRIFLLGGALLLFEFEEGSDAEMVLSRGVRRFEGTVLHLDRWTPEIGCCRKGEHAKEVWMRVVGLPLHLWGPEVLKKIGDSCGGFVAVDEDTAHLRLLQWARVLVRLDGRRMPGMLKVVVGLSCFSIQLWWEVPPWFSTEVSSCGFSGLEVRGEVTGETRAVESVRVQVPLQQLEADAVSHGRSEGKGLVVVDGSEKAMVGSGLQKAVEGNGDGKQANCNRRCLGGVSCKGTRSGAAGGLKNLGFQGLKEAQVVQGFSSKAAHLCSGPLEGSKVLKSKEACGVGHLAKKAHRLPALCVAQGGGEGSVNVHYRSDSKNSPSEEPTLLGASFSSRGHYFQNRKLFPPVELHTSTDMALMEEAARHPGSFSFSVSPLGTRAASSPSFCGTDLGSEGCGVVFVGDKCMPKIQSIM